MKGVQLPFGFCISPVRYTVGFGFVKSLHRPFCSSWPPCGFLTLIIWIKIAHEFIRWIEGAWNQGVHANRSTFIWVIAQRTVIYGIESVQDRSARFILSKYFRLASVSLIKLNLGLPDLLIGRKLSRLSMFYIFFYNPSLKQILITQPSYLSARKDHQFNAAIY